MGWSIGLLVILCVLLTIWGPDFTKDEMECRRSRNTCPKCGSYIPRVSGRGDPGPL
jgi:hypothetical protein